MTDLYNRTMNAYDSYIDEMDNSIRMSDKIIALVQAAYCLGQAEMLCSDAMKPYKYGENSNCDDWAWNMGEFMGMKSNIIAELRKNEV